MYVFTINKDIETDTVFNLKIKQNSQATRELLPFEIFRLSESEFLSHLALYSSLVLGLKVCTTTRPLWLTSVAAGIKGVCHHCLACMVD